LSVIVPVLNEAEGISQLRDKLGRVQSVLGEFGDIEFVFVDDGSNDGTFARLHEAFPESDTCRIVSHGRNRGVGAAFRTGFQNATGSIVCTIDADCSYEPEGLKRLVDAMEKKGGDIAVASPYHPDGSVQGVGAWRLLSKNRCWPGDLFYGGRAVLLEHFGWRRAVRGNPFRWIRIGGKNASRVAIVAGWGGASELIGWTASRCRPVIYLPGYVR